MRTFIIIITLAILLACSKKKETQFLIDVPGVVNRTPAEVERILGEPDTTYMETILGKKIFCQRYRKYDVELQYHSKVCSDVVVYGDHGLPFNQSALKAFNIGSGKQHPSQYEKDALMRWYDVDNFRTISFYNVKKDRGGDVAHFDIYFKAKPL